MIGQRFGRLVVEAREQVERKGSWWRCRCDCGAHTVAITAKLRNGHKRSCGCLKDENWRDATHGLHGTPEHSVWEGIKRRCLMPSEKAFPHYGGRGVRISDAWRDDFAAFLAHVGPRPSATHSIERIDVNGHYEPGNVRWATPAEQARNKRNNRSISLDGETRILVEWCEVYGISPKNVVARERIGWSIEDAIKTPVRSASRGRSPCP
jgi:hypothetical protein